MTNDNLRDKLISSDAFKSLDIESKVEKAFIDKLWKVVRSPYYKDRKSDKHRELDLVCSLTYSQEKGEDEVISEVMLLIECKSISDYHIIIEDSNYEGNINDLNLWVGYDNYNMYQKLNGIVSKSNFNEQDCKKIVQKFEEITFPNKFSLVGDCRPNVFSNIIKTTTFRETNTSNSRELDNSVVWKAFQTISSATNSYIVDYWEQFEHSLLSDMDVAKRYKYKLSDVFGFDVMSYIVKHTLLHKVLVIDSNIWVKDGSSLNSIGLFRLLQQNLDGYNDDWVDIVSLKYLEEYVELLTTHYCGFFETNKMKKS